MYSIRMHRGVVVGLRRAPPRIDRGVAAGTERVRERERASNQMDRIRCHQLQILAELASLVTVKIAGCFLDCVFKCR